MPTTVEPEKGLAKEVTPETIRKVNFITGSGTTLRNCVVHVSAGGQAFRARIDSDGKVTIIEEGVVQKGPRRKSKRK